MPAVFSVVDGTQTVIVFATSPSRTPTALSLPVPSAVRDPTLTATLQVHSSDLLQRGFAVIQSSLFAYTYPLTRCQIYHHYHRDSQLSPASAPACLERDGGDKPNLQTLPAGVVVTLASDVRESGLVDILCGDAGYTALYEDVSQRGEAAATFAWLRNIP